MSETWTFEFPWVLGMLALLPLYAWWHGKVAGRSALIFPSAEIARAVAVPARSSAGRWLLFLRLLTLALTIVALAGPQRVNARVETHTPGIDIMLVLDLSWSMEAVDMGRPDQKLSRFAIASGVLRDFIAGRPDDRIGLISFSGVPYLTSPLTLDHHWLIENLDRLHIGIISDLGTAIGDAVAVAAKRLAAVPGSRSRVMILLTDGDNNLGKVDPLPAAQLAAAMGVKIYAIGIGNEEPCNLPRFDPATGRFILDEQGRIIPTLVLQPANYAVLGQMASLSGGRFFRATTQHELQSIYKEIDRLEKTSAVTRQYTIIEPLYQYWLLAALAVLTIEFLLQGTRFCRIP